MSVPNSTTKRRRFCKSEIAADYTFAGKSKVQTFSYSELSPEQHRQALEIAFANGAIKGCQNCEDSIKRAYAACGFPYGDGKVTKLKSFLMNKRMVIRENGTYSYNPDFYY